MLAARLARLERAHRRLQRVTGAALLLLAATVLVAATTAPRSLELNALKIVDGNGKARVLLTAATGVSILDAEGRPRASLAVDGQGPGLVLYGEKDDGRAILNVNADGPALAFTGAQGALRAILALVAEGPGLVLYDEHSHDRAVLAVRGDGGVLKIQDAAGQTVEHTR